MAKPRTIFTVLVILAFVSISECAKKPVTVARKEDIPYIKCQVCEKLAAQLHHQVEKKQAEIEPKKVTLSSGYSSGDLNMLFFRI